MDEYIQYIVQTRDKKRRDVLSTAQERVKSGTYCSCRNTYVKRGYRSWTESRQG